MLTDGWVNWIDLQATRAQFQFQFQFQFKMEDSDNHNELLKDPFSAGKRKEFKVTLKKNM